MEGDTTPQERDYWCGAVQSLEACLSTVNRIPPLLPVAQTNRSNSVSISLIFVTHITVAFVSQPPNHASQTAERQRLICSSILATFSKQTRVIGLQDPVLRPYPGPFCQTILTKYPALGVPFWEFARFGKRRTPRHRPLPTHLQYSHLGISSLSLSCEDPAPAYGFVRYEWIAAAARRPAPMARITVALPVTMSPPANTPLREVCCVVGSASI